MVIAKPLGNRKMMTLALQAPQHEANEGVDDQNVVKENFLPS